MYVLVADYTMHLAKIMYMVVIIPQTITFKSPKIHEQPVENP